MTDTKPKKLSPEEQTNLDRCLISAARDGDTETVQTLLTAGAHVHAQNDYALRRAAWNGHTETVKTLLAASADVHAVNDYALRWATENGRTETVKTLLAAGANVHARDDWALCLAEFYGHMETVRVLARHIFAPDSWRGKRRAAIEAHANSLYDKIKAQNIQPERLREAGTILIDSALTCWEQVRPAPPKLTISPLPAQPRPV